MATNVIIGVTLFYIFRSFFFYIKTQNKLSFSFQGDQAMKLIIQEEEESLLLWL
jgi:hypothetical protein